MTLSRTTSAGLLLLAFSAALQAVYLVPDAELYVVSPLSRAYVNVALLFLHALLALNVLRGRPQLRPHHFALIGVSYLLLVFAYARILHPLPDVSPTESQRLEQDGAALVRSLESYRTRHGTYPKRLQDAAGAVAPTRFGNWSYRRENDRRYALCVGDYARHGFALCWDAARRRWRWDM